MIWFYFCAIVTAACRVHSLLSLNKACFRSTSLSSLTAKSPPKAQFDLDALEAYEEQLYKSQFGHETTGLEFNPDEDENDIVTKTHLIPEHLNGKRIDAVIAELEPSFSRSLGGSLVAAGHVRFIVKNEKNQSNFETILQKSFKVKAGQELQISVRPPTNVNEIVAQDIPLDILYEDEYMIVLNKAANMVVHPAAGNWDGTVVNALAFYLARSQYGSGEYYNDTKHSFSPSDKNEQKQDFPDNIMNGETNETNRPGIVHRLDKGTTGVLVVAKTRLAHVRLSEFFASRQVKKTYLAITVGNPGHNIVIDKPIGRHPVYRQRMRVVPDPHTRDSHGMASKDRLSATTLSTGRRAVSFVDTLAFDSKLSFVQVQIETGRTHQIRVHLQDHHTPIYGDDIYGLPDWNKRLLKSHQIERPLLHAYKLELPCHPIHGGTAMVFQAPMADDMLKIVKTICPDELNGSWT